MATTKVLLCVAVFLVINVASMDITLSNVKKAVWGSNVTFIATVLGYRDGYDLSLKFHDNATPQHTKEITVSSNVTTWTVEYPKSLYEPRDYTVNVDLWRYNHIFWYHVASAANTFQLTDSLNGNLTIKQNDMEMKNGFVAVNSTVEHRIQLPEGELQFLLKNSSSTTTYWFVDCVPRGSTNDFSFNYTYAETMKDHQIVAILVASTVPEPTITTTTTPATTSTPTPTPNPTTEKPSTSTDNQTTTENQTITTEPTTSKQTAAASTVTEKNNATEVIPLQQEVNKSRRKRNVPESNCVNPHGLVGYNDTYGRFEANLSVREPISTVSITGPNWLQHGDLLNLEVKYTGSPPFKYCVFYKPGLYNVTTNETCANETQPTIMANTFPLVHYFSDSDKHTVVVVIENDLGKNVSQFTINIYKTPVHAQLSVILVPVFFCLVAVILVVFGIAYYQHRSRHTVEVADFDFGQAHPDFKTFRERLRDSFRNAFNFGHRDDTDPLTTNSRYDSMSSS